MTNVERPFEITHIPPRLHRDFDGRLTTANSGSNEERERNFLSRALAAFTIHKNSGCTLEEAAQSVVDGGGDCRIDAVFYSPTSNTLWLVQSKFIAKGTGQPDLGEVSKFCDGITALLQGNFNFFDSNNAWTSRLPVIQRQMQAPALRILCALVYSGLAFIEEDRLRLFDAVKRRFNHEDDYVTFRVFGLTSVHDWISGADEILGVIEVNLELHYSGWLRSPYETIYGLIRLSDLSHLYLEYGENLIAANIRRFRGATKVNEQITSTLQEEPHHFFYLNNGLTAYCTRLDVNNIDRDNAIRKRVVARGFSIVNGAQTVGSVKEVCTSASVSPPDGFAFIKIISLQHCEDDLTFARRITQSTNYQNQIGPRDFVSLDEQQRRIASQLSLSGISYHYQESEDTPTPDNTNFTLVEAMTALASMEQDSSCDLISRILGNRTSIWQTEADRARNEEVSRFFRPDLSARTIWRAVQAQRTVIERLQAEARAAVGIRKAYFENSRWFILNIIFLKLRPERGEDLTLSPNETSAISTKTLEFAEILWLASESAGFFSRTLVSGLESFQQARHFRSVFSSASDCQILRNSLLARLAQPPITNPDLSTQRPQLQINCD